MSNIVIKIRIGVTVMIVVVMEVILTNIIIPIQGCNVSFVNSMLLGTGAFLQIQQA